MLYTLAPRRVDLLCRRGPGPLLLQYHDRQTGTYDHGEITTNDSSFLSVAA